MEVADCDTAQTRINAMKTQLENTGWNISQSYRLDEDLPAQP
jgi:hypothetical protein